VLKWSYFFQVAQAYDDSVTQEVTNHLFQEPGKKWGMDLAAINMQRGREQGIPGYGRYEKRREHFSTCIK
jgi:peroxidase